MGRVDTNQLCHLQLKVKSSKSLTLSNSEILEHRVRDPESVYRSKAFWRLNSLSMVAIRVQNSSASRVARLVRIASVSRELSLFGNEVLMITGLLCLFVEVWYESDSNSLSVS